MKKVILLFSVMCLLLAVGCQQPQVDRMGQQLYTMQELPHKLFSLDDSTTQVLTYIHTFMEDSALMLASYNAPMHDICIFDVKTGEEVRKVKFEREGPDGLGNNVFGFLYHNQDSIFVYHTWLFQLDLYNSQGELLKKFNLRQVPVEGNSAFVMPEFLPCTSYPIKKAGDCIILQGQGGRLPDPNPSNLQKCVTGILNMKDSVMYFDNPYPEVYGGKGSIWQPFAYLVTPYDLTPDGKMLLGFQADDSVRVYDMDTRCSKAYFAGYSKAERVRPARSASPVDVGLSIVKQVQYAGIYYDRWNNLYYRLVALPTSDYDVNKEVFPARNLAIVILDEDFQKVGEYEISEKTDRYNSVFVSPDGLHINVLSEDDDYMEFITVKPKRL